METCLARFQPYMLSILRFMAGLLILQHGTVKWLGFPAAAQGAGSGSLSTMSGVGGLFELICGFLVAVGLFSRPAAFLLSGMTAVAYFSVHAQRVFFPIMNGGELVALYSFTMLYLACAGPGPWSLDAVIRNKG
jgi:putative oxidoreductase